MISHVYNMCLLVLAHQLMTIMNSVVFAAIRFDQSYIKVEMQWSNADKNKSSSQQQEKKSVKSNITEQLKCKEVKIK